MWEGAVQTLGCLVLPSIDGKALLIVPQICQDRAEQVQNKRELAITADFLSF